MSLQERIPKLVYELSFSATDERLIGFLRAILVALKIEEYRLAEEFENGHYLIKIFSEQSDEIEKLNQLFKKLKLAGLKAKKSTLRPKDWLTRWKVGWKPAALTKQLDVVPVWYKDKYRPKKGRGYILMDTLLSFGTGLHETTQIVSQFIEDHQGRFKSFLDIGTGTGILALVALHHGATSVRALDIGDLSVQAAKHNFKVNKAKGTILKADISKYKDQKQYDFVAANLITHDLIDHRHILVGLVKSGGLLAISGISLDNLPKLRAAFKDLPLTCLTIKKATQWSGLLYQKKI